MWCVLARKIARAISRYSTVLRETPVRRLIRLSAIHGVTMSDCHLRAFEEKYFLLAQERHETPSKKTKMFRTNLEFHCPLANRVLPHRKGSECPDFLADITMSVYGAAAACIGSVGPASFTINGACFPGRVEREASAGTRMGG